MTVFGLKQTVARAIGRGYPLDRLVGRGGRRYVMAYHRVISASTAAADDVHSAMWITPDTLAAQIAWMRRVGEIVDLTTLLSADHSTPRPLFALTFDDGWRDNYTEAWPVLRAAAAPATIFLVSDAIDRDALFWTEDVLTKTHRVVQNGGETRVREALDALWPASALKPMVASTGTSCDVWVEALKIVPESERRSRVDEYLERIGASTEPLRGYILTWDQAREMSRGGITFGSHTHTHRILDGLEHDEMTRELSISKDIISRQLQRDITLFCYPNARYAGDEGAALARCGYRYGFVIDSRQVRAPVDPYYVPRFLMNEEIARNRDYMTLHLLEAPLYAGRPHRRRPTPSGMAAAVAQGAPLGPPTPSRRRSAGARGEGG